MHKPLPSPLNPTGASEEQKEQLATADAHRHLALFMPLLENPNFQAFWASVGAKVEEQMKAALDLSKDKDTRDKHAHIHHALKSVHEFPQKAVEAARERIQAHKAREQARQASAQNAGIA